MESGNRWYIVNVMAGQENKVAADMKVAVVKHGLSNHVSEILIPTKKVTKIKKGQKIQESQKIFPGYVFVNANLSGGVHNVINSIPKVMGFLGGKNDPKPVEESKMKEVLQMSANQESDNKVVLFDIGETLNVIDGPFESFTGVVENFDLEKQKVKISILIFGRATSVELNFDQVEKSI